VKIEDVIRVLHANSAHARELIARVIPKIGADLGPCPHGCDRTLDTAILTAPEARDPELVRRLDAVAGRVLRRSAGP
jgi:5'-methylthioadenosine phosphorylase